MHYECMARDCNHTFTVKTQKEKISLFLKCPECGCVAQLKDGAMTARDFIQIVRGEDLTKSTFYNSIKSVSSCPFAGKCYLFDQYITDCAHQKQVNHRCLVRFDDMIDILDYKLDKILSYLEKS
ncbi:hypothetical protein [Campylobacter ureolyticus]|uniref:hypothetical protein n=2 Tax=Campylobacter ureolyticus TaxID=827 RepID=UPI0022B315D0|nr:hypothetical protein [Campylobacter ureolyticus]MCZ6111001.1 hypothetical protein [Campylobacter ureolyticus]MCZ6174683.1 hypothetical protein [Campylobacter ureolyticus]